MTCDELQDVGAELALGLLSSNERDQASQHLGSCATCRQIVERFSALSDEILALVPAIEPPVGFEDRAMARLTLHSQPTLQRPTLRRRHLRPIAAAAVALTVAGAIGWTLGTDSAHPHSTATSSTKTSTGSDDTDITQTRFVRDSHNVGQLFAYSGSPAWIFMTIENPAMNGVVQCEVQDDQGNISRVGSFPLVNGTGSWGVTSPVPTGKLRSARLLDSTGTVIATATLPA